MSKFSTRFLIISMTLAVSLITSNFFVPRLWKIPFFDLQLSGAVLLFPVSYILNDCLTEVYGYRKARLVIWIAFALSLFTAIMSDVVRALPAPIDPAAQEIASSFNGLFHMVPITTAASLIAFLLGSHVNAWVMSRMKVSSKGRRFGWRAIISSLAGELADSIVFYPIVFAAILPATQILKLAALQISVKVLYEIIILPVTTLIVNSLKQKEKLDTFDEGISYNPFKIADV